MRRAHRHRRRWRRTGFTIIEILVVVAIIGVLVSILVPALSKARFDIKLTICRTNLREIGVAMTTYSQASRGWFPPAPYIGSTLWEMVDNPCADDNLFVLWYGKFVGNPSIFNCPATTHRIRAPNRIEKVPTSLGIKFIIHTAGSAGHVNDFERLAQYEGTGGFGTSYEYDGWYSVPSVKTNINSFYHDHVLSASNRYVDKAAIYNLSAGFTKPGDIPWRRVVLGDADDADWMARNMGFKGITGSNGNANNNSDATHPPDPWDNHGVLAANELYADGHSKTKRWLNGKQIN